jgi:hypothetical protein
MKYLPVIVAIVLFTFSSSAIQAQVRLSGQSLPELRRVDPLPVYSTYFSQSIQHFSLLASNPQTSYPVNFKQLAPTQIPQAWSYHDLAFFCRLEVKLEKATNFPIKFRLGEVQYAENREGKYGDLQQRLGN